MPRLFFFLLVGLFLGCGPKQAATQTRCPDAQARELADDASVPAAKDRRARSLLADEEPEEDPEKPNNGMLRVLVAGVVGDGIGQDAVILLQPETERVLPIWIGKAEATAIALRLSGESFPRPLTHDLLDKVMAHAGSRIARVEVDALEDSTFLAQLFIIDRDGRLMQIDARPSDSIALAVGAKAPIFVARTVLEQAGQSAAELGIDPATLPRSKDPRI